MHSLAIGSLTGIIGVLTGFGLVVVLPIVALLLSHQRKMAEIVRGKDAMLNQDTSRRIEQLEAEVRALRQQVTDNILAFDDQRGRALAPPPAPEQILPR